MPYQNPLFDTLEAEPSTPDAAKTKATVAVALKLQAEKLSPEQQRFNKLLAQVEKLSQKTEQLQALADRFIPLLGSTLSPLVQEHSKCKRAMIISLHERLQRSGLTATQRRQASRLICGMSQPYAMQGDVEMQTIHDSYSEQTIAQSQQEAADETRAMLEDYFDMDIAGADQHSSPEDMLRAAMAQAREREEAEDAKRAARKTKRSASKKQIEAEQKELDAHSALKTIYRQLASALHPDRESDDAVRIEKTALMGRVNAAYERRDLLSLLRLQLESEHVDSSRLSTLASERVVAMSRLLKEQADALKDDVAQLESTIDYHFHVYPGQINEAALTRFISSEKSALLDSLDLMREDTLAVQDDKLLKRWLKQQIAILADYEREQAMMADLGSMFGGGMFR
jgi:hypothetical protein